MYNMVNKRLPGWQDPPSRKVIQEALHAFDSNKDGVLDPREVNRKERKSCTLFRFSLNGVLSTLSHLSFSLSLSSLFPL